jgi:DNA-binding NtrC family response regulator
MTPLNILVLHRDPAQREALVSMLRRGNHQVFEAESPANAAVQLGGSVDALLLDLRLPGLDIDDLRQALSSDKPTEPDSLDAAERRHLALVLRHTAGNKRRAALILGISRSTLLNKVRKYQLEDR